MTQAQLDRAVARATGETVDFVRNHGFNHLIVPTVVKPRLEGGQALAYFKHRTRQAEQKNHPARRAA